MVSSLYELENMLKAAGVEYRRVGEGLLVEYDDAEYGKIGMSISVLEEEAVVRIAVPTDAEPTKSGLRTLMHENFVSARYKYALDYEGFIAVVVDVPSSCIRSARELKEAMASALEGARRLLERVEERESESTEGGGSRQG
ncbi:MAG: hypothetical protein ABWW70_05650 [Thermoproteota archaeon]